MMITSPAVLAGFFLEACPMARPHDIKGYEQILQQDDIYFALTDREAFFSLLNDYLTEDGQLTDIFMDLYDAGLGIQRLSSSACRDNPRAVVSYFLTSPRYAYHDREVSKVYFALNTWLSFFGAKCLDTEWTKCPFCSSAIRSGLCEGSYCRSNTQDFREACAELARMLAREEEGEATADPVFWNKIRSGSEFDWEYRRKILELRAERGAESQKKAREKRLALGKQTLETVASLEREALRELKNKLPDLRRLDMLASEAEDLKRSIDEKMKARAVEFADEDGKNLSAFFDTFVPTLKKLLSSFDALRADCRKTLAVFEEQAMRKRTVGGGARFCHGCGAPWNGSRFCSSCGTELSSYLKEAETEKKPQPPKPETVSPKPEKTVTVTAKPVETVQKSTAPEIFQVDNGILSAYRGKDTRVVLPKGVTSIGEKAFSENTSIEEIVLPEGLKQIPVRAFCGCTALKRVSLSASVETIGSFAFERCFSLEEIRFEKNGRLRDIGDRAFAACRSLKSVEIPNTVSYIGEMAFIGCSAMTSLSLPFLGEKADAPVGSKRLFGHIFGSVSFDQAVGVRQFYSPKDSVIYYIPTSLRSVTVTGVVEIAYGALSNCRSLKSVTFMPGVRKIGMGALWGCSSLESLAIPFVGESPFAAGTLALFGRIFGTNPYEGSTPIEQEYTKADAKTYHLPATLKRVDLNGATRIPNRAFHRCATLTEIRLHEGLQKIENHAFLSCRGLLSIHIPASVEKIEKGAFVFCNAMTSLVVEKGNATYFSNKNCVVEKKSGALVAVCPHFVLLEEHGVKTINAETFWGMSFTELTLPSTVESIGEDAFHYCNSLKIFKIPEGSQLKSIAAHVFADCTALKQITYGGKASAWKAIRKASGWGEKEVKCTDKVLRGK